MTFDYKAGIGTASRVLPECDATLGVLVLANFGVREDFVLDGVPVGKLLGGTRVRGSGDGSCIAVVVTDAPLGPHELTRIARRCGLGLARTGSVAYDGSGEIFLALSTGGRIEREAGGTRPVASPRMLNELFAATVEATEEAVLNALWAAPEVVGREGRVAPCLPHDEVLELLAAAPTASRYGGGMCRNIRTLHNFEPPATEGEVQAAALQYVRKVSGSTKPSKANEQAFARAVADIAAVTQRLLDELVTTAAPRDRELEAARARARAAVRFGTAA